MARFNPPAPATGDHFSKSFLTTMDGRIAERSNYQALVDRHIVPGGRDTADTVMAAKKMLKTGMVRNHLNSYLSHRPTPTELLDHHILEEGYDKVAPRMQRAQKAYDLARRKDSLGHSLMNRPLPADLKSRNILKDNNVHGNNAASMEALRRSMLEDNLTRAFGATNRPSREALLERGVIPASLPDKIVGLRHDEAIELLLRLSFRGGLWEHEIDSELEAMKDDGTEGSADLKKFIGGRRPSIIELKERGVIKMKNAGSGERLLATRNLSRNLKYRPTKAEVESRNIIHDGSSSARISSSRGEIREFLGRRPSAADVKKLGYMI